MKPSLISLAVLFVLQTQLTQSTSAQASQIPDCWSGYPDVPTRYLINVDIAAVSKDTLVTLLDKSRGSHIDPIQFPNVVLLNQEQHLTFTLRAVDHNIDRHRLSPAQLKAAVHAELQPLAELEGVQIQCPNPE